MTADLLRRTARLVVALARPGYTPLAEIERQAGELQRALDAAEPVHLAPLKPEPAELVIERARSAGL